MARKIATGDPTPYRPRKGKKASGAEQIRDAVDNAIAMPSFILNKDGNPRALGANAIEAIRFAKMWQGVIGFNEFAIKTVALKPPAWDHVAEDDFEPRDWTDIDDIRMAEWLQRNGIHVPPSTAADAVQVVARDNAFHPVRAYLERLEWDGRARLDTWLSYFLGADDSPYARTVGAKWMISAVARIYRPGTKADCVLILEGPQGLGKSTALRTLANPWFSDEVAEFGTKDAAMQLAGVWLIELAELDSMNRSGIDVVKGFLSRSVDRFRPPYGRRLTEVPRQCIFGGTVNASDYLKDETGGRRFWPVRCSSIDTDALRRERDQLWAEAAHRFRDGETWWIDDPAVRRQAEAEQADRYVEDPWSYDIGEFLIGRNDTCVVEILDHLGKGKRDRTQADQNRVVRVLKSLGWTRYRARDGARLTWRYRVPTVPTDEG